MLVRSWGDSGPASIVGEQSAFVCKDEWKWLQRRRWHCRVHTDAMADVSWLMSTSVEKSHIVPERTVLVFLK